MRSTMPRTAQRPPCSPDRCHRACGDNSPGPVSSWLGGGPPLPFRRSLMLRCSCTESSRRSRTFWQEHPWPPSRTHRWAAAPRAALLCARVALPAGLTADTAAARRCLARPCSSCRTTHARTRRREVFLPAAADMSGNRNAHQTAASFRGRPRPPWPHAHPGVPFAIVPWDALRRLCTWTATLPATAGPRR